MIFKEFVKQVNSSNVQEKEVYVNVFEDSMILNPLILKDKLCNIDNIQDAELFNIIKYNYSFILSDIFDNSRVSDFTILFTNSRFVSIMTQVISNTNLSYDEAIYLNKIVYDYLTISQSSDDYLKQLMISLSKVVNRNVIPILVGLGIPEHIATDLALSRYSSSKELTNVKRLNFAIMKYSRDIMSEQMIIYIYEKLFNKFTQLFEGVMFDTDRDCLNSEMDEIYSTISLAVLNILESMPSINIQRVLTTYMEDFYGLNIKHCRFGIRTISPDDYPRTLSIVYDLERRGVYIP